MKSCGVCGEPRRKGGRVVVLGPEAGKIRTVLACKSCRDRSVTIAIAPLSTERARKTLVLGAAEKEVREALRRIARRLRVLSRLDSPNAPGLECAADIVEGAARNEGERQLGE